MDQFIQNYINLDRCSNVRRCVINAMSYYKQLLDECFTINNRKRQTKLDDFFSKK